LYFKCPDFQDVVLSNETIPTSPLQYSLPSFLLNKDFSSCNAQTNQDAAFSRESNTSGPIQYSLPSFLLNKCSSQVPLLQDDPANFNDSVSFRKSIPAQPPPAPRVCGATPSSRSIVPNSSLETTQPQVTSIPNYSDLPKPLTTSGGKILDADLQEQKKRLKKTQRKEDLQEQKENTLQGSLEKKLDKLRLGTQGDDDSDNENDDAWGNEENNGDSKIPPVVSQNSSEEALKESSYTASANSKDIQITGGDVLSFEKSKQESNPITSTPGDFKSQLQQEFRKRGIQDKE